jgi:glycine/D-amino acid oxidase-like deaminating enzyme
MNEIASPRSSQPLDVAVIGAGIAGLAAAQLLTRAGRTVEVFDGAPAGGRARSHTRSGFTFNLGPRALYLGGAGHAVLNQLGVRRSGGKPKITGTHFLSQGTVITAPTSPLGFLNSPALGAKGKMQVGRLMGSLPKFKPADFAQISVENWFADIGLSRDATATMRTLVRLGTYCEDLDLLSADAAIVALQASAKGVQYLDHGWQSLVDQLSVGLIINHTAASSITSDGAEANVVLSDATVVRAHTVIVAVNSPTSAQHLLAVTFPAFGPPSVTSCLNVGTTAPPPTRIVLGLDEPVYLSTHCPPAKLTADETDGRAVVQLMRYQRSNTDTMSPHESRSSLESLLRLSGIPDNLVVESEYLHSMVACSAIPTAALGGMAGRTTSGATRHANVLLAGDYVGPVGTLVDTSLASAAAAADRALHLL